ncbi:hypothetical protein P3L51_02970 [Streptomyces sp. PSRA5]
MSSHGAELSAGTAAADARDKVLALLEELHTARHGTGLSDGDRG